MHTILVVDDSETIQRAVAIAFGHEPFRLVTAAFVELGVALARAAPPDLVLVDHTLADGSAWDLAAQLRTSPATARIPVVVLTAPSLPFDEARGREHGIRHHVEKPFECDALLECARAALGIAPPAPTTTMKAATPAPATRPAASTPPTRTGASPPPLPRDEPLLPPPPAPPWSTPASATATMPPVGMPVFPASGLPRTPTSPGARPGTGSAPATTSTLPRTTTSTLPRTTTSTLPTPTSTTTMPPTSTPVPADLARPPTLPPMPATLTRSPTLPPMPATLARSPTLPPTPSAASFDDRDHRWLHDLLRNAVQQGASDIHVHATRPMRMRRFGTLWPIPDSELPPDVVRAGLLSILDDADRATFDRDGQVDCGLSLPVGRFRVNLYRQHRGMDGVFRVVLAAPPTLESLRLPASLARLTELHQGIVLVTGPGSSGKSSTLAALVHRINVDRADHIVTIEDPIEVLHPSVNCVVNQRQAGRDTRSFPRALKAALREDPDVIVIGEMRDRETAQLALTAAETGHLVLATLHTQNAVRTINRVIGEFPPAQQPNVRAMLAESLRAVVSQRLLPRKDQNGVVPAVELLHNVPAVANLIRESRTHQIRSTMQTGTALGMQTLETSLSELVGRGLVDLEVARRAAEDPKAVAAPTAILPGVGTPGDKGG
jgi:twitching motility protein PilT